MSVKRQTLWSMAPLLVVTLINFVSVPLFYRYLGPTLYALWFYVQTLSGSFGFMDLGIGTAIGRYVGVALGKGDREAAIEYWATGNAAALPFLIAFGALYIILGYYLGPIWFHVAADKQRLLRQCFLAGGLSLALAYYNQFWAVLSQSHLDFKFISITRVAMSLLQIIPAIFIARFTADPLFLILWSVVIGFLQLCVFVLHARLKYRIGLPLGRASMSRFREMFTYTGKAFATLIINCILTPVDRLVAGRLVPSVQFAHYTIASNLGARASSFGFAAVAPVFANTSRSVGEEKARSSEIYNETFRFLSSWYVLGVVWLTVWSELLCRFWLGVQTGSQVAPLIPPLLIGYALTGISLISSAQLGALNRLGTQALFHLATGILTIPAVWIGWEHAGLLGLAYGYAFSRLPLVAQDIYLLRLIKAGGWLEPAIWIDIFVQTFVGLCFLALRHIFSSSLVWLIVFAVIHGGAVASWLLWHKVFGHKTLQPVDL